MATIVTLTGYPEIFAQFRRWADESHPDARKIVVTSRGVKLSLPEPWEVVRGAEPFVFARNANIGIAAAAPDDVLLVNDDVQLRYPETLERLRERAHFSERIGIVSPQVIGRVGNPLQCRERELSADLTISRDRLAFVCVYIKRAVLDSVGPLDERFDGYGGDDDDYCLRAQRLGYQLAVTPSAVVRHEFEGCRATASFSRCPTCNGTGVTPELAESTRRMQKVFFDKHGIWPYGVSEWA